jgi:Flp pilus assembly protein TadD
LPAISRNTRQNKSKVKRPYEALAGRNISRASAFNKSWQIAAVCIVLAFQPGNYNAHEALGVVLFQLGDYEKAAAQFRYAVRIDPTSAEARRNLALALDRMGNEQHVM